MVITLINAFVKEAVQQFYMVILKGLMTLQCMAGTG